MITRWWAGPKDGEWLDLPDATKAVLFEPPNSAPAAWKVPVVDGLIRYDLRELLPVGSEFPETRGS